MIKNVKNMNEKEKAILIINSWNFETLLIRCKLNQKTNL